MGLRKYNGFLLNHDLFGQSLQIELMLVNQKNSLDHENSSLKEKNL